MKLAPSPLAPLAMRLDQPLACAVDLQPGRVDHDVNRPARLGSCQRRRERQARAAPGKRGVVGYTNTDIEQGRERAQQALSLPPRPTKGQAQQVPGLDRHVRVVAGSPPLARAGRVPGRKRLGRDPDREAAALLECPVVLWPVADLVARPGALVAARLIGLVGHRASGKRGSGPIRSTLAQPKPKARNFAPTPASAATGLRQEVAPRTLHRCALPNLQSRMATSGSSCWVAGSAKSFRAPQ